MVEREVQVAQEGVRSMHHLSDLFGDHATLLPNRVVAHVEHVEGGVTTHRFPEDIR
jgi:hypothetical protein